MAKWKCEQFKNNPVAQRKPTERKDEDWKYVSDGTKICFTSKRDENERITKWYASNLSKTSIDFNEDAPLPEID